MLTSAVVFFAVFLLARLARRFIFAKVRVDPLGLVVLVVLAGGVSVLSVTSLAWLGPQGTFLLAGLGLIAIVASILVAQRSRRGQRWAEAGLCERCGYDLRASFERCPECGDAIPESLARRRRIAAELTAQRSAVQLAAGEVPDRQ